MATTITNRVLSEAMLPAEGTALVLRRAALVLAGIAAMAVAAKIKVPMWPVPITLQTFVILSIGAAYGARLGGLTVLGYLALGALGADVFTGSSASDNGIAYMLGGTGGYLLGFLLAAVFLGRAAEHGWDRSPLRMAGAYLAGSALIYVPGLLWLHQFAADWGQTLAWGLTPFLVGDALKMALAAMLFPLAWRAVGSARA